jgi:predicted DNA binding protein
MLLINMDIVKIICRLYEDVGKQVKSRIPDKLKCICESQVDEETGSFTVTLEILVIDKIVDRDNGITFSTNAQQFSHNDVTKIHAAQGLYLISDLSYADGEIIDSIIEQNYILSENSNKKEILETIESFTLSKVNSIPKILNNRYGVSYIG